MSKTAAAGLAGPGSTLAKASVEKPEKGAGEPLIIA